LVVHGVLNGSPYVTNVTNAKASSTKTLPGMNVRVRARRHVVLGVRREALCDAASTVPVHQKVSHQASASWTRRSP
jgi:hypothetical protein